MRLDEILDSKPAPFKWLSDEICEFELDGQSYGIAIEFVYLVLETLPSQLNCANVSFGIVENGFSSADDLDTSLTGANRQFAVFNTVAQACIANNQVMSSDVIVLGGADEVADKRSALYSLLWSKLSSKLDKRYEDFNRFNIKMNGHSLFIVSQHRFSDEEKEELATKLNFSK
jgi:hypothetical protein